MTRSTGHIVLLVDDAPQSLGALAAELTADGCTVLIADSGEAALALLTHRKAGVCQSEYAPLG